MEPVLRWWDNRSRAERVLMTTAILLALVLTARNLVIEPMLGWHETIQGKISQREILLRTREEFLQKRPQMEENLRKVREQRSRLNVWLLSGKTPALSAVELQEIVQNIAAKSGSRITSISVVPHEVKEGFRKISVKLIVESDLAGLTQLLQGLEEDRKKLLVPNLEVRSLTSRAARRVPGRENLRTSLTVFGWMKNGDASSPQEGGRV